MKGGEFPVYFVLFGSGAANEKALATAANCRKFACTWYIDCLLTKLDINLAVAHNALHSSTAERV